MRVSIVLPAYNEATKLADSVHEVVRVLTNLNYDFEVIIAEDGSTDGTDLIASELSNEIDNVVHLHYEERLGRGKALVNAFRYASGDIVVYMDVDLSTNLKHLPDLINAINVEGYDIAIGSRLSRGSKVERSIKRDLASKIYNLLVRILLGSRIQDHQCGFKAFKKDIILDICKNVKDNHWFWDTEVLILAQKLGYKIKEIPVEWRQRGRSSKVEFKKDVVYMFSQILRLWFENLRKSRKYFLFTVLLALLLLAILAFKAGFSELYSALLKVRFSTILLASILYGSSYIIRGARFEYILNRLNYRTGLYFSTAAVSISQTVNVLTPIRIGDRMENFVGKIFSSAKAAMGIKDSLVILIFSGFIWLTDIFVCYVIASNFKYPPILLISLSISLANIVKTVPITPGGIGTYEATMTTLLMGFYNIQEAFVISLVDHAIKNLITIILGLVAIVSLNVKLREVKEI
ncbi:dolichol-P-glucose synthetase [Archaeoglobales archaeon ex4484_92]|nr:MAG: dolichol-P-glucose synthetase [Archaeoglobales archaeon ex4484_92]